MVAALEAVATEYEKEQRRGNKKEIFVYEQIKKTCRQISFGVPHRPKAFSEMGKRLGCLLYQKLSVLFVPECLQEVQRICFELKVKRKLVSFAKKNMQKGKENKQA